MAVKKGAAVEYSGDVPRIVATARGFLFEKLIEIARENNITIYKDADLAEVLTQIEPGKEIPEILFKAVSHVLAFCYRVNRKFRNKIDNRVIF